MPKYVYHLEVTSKDGELVDVPMTDGDEMLIDPYLTALLVQAGSSHQEWLRNAVDVRLKAKYIEGSDSLVELTRLKRAPDVE